MGTNYYLSDGRDRLSFAARDGLHIGKSSVGWCFSLHVLPEHGLNTLSDWRALWNQPDMVITNESGETVTPDEMVAIITDRAGRLNDPDCYPNRWYASEADMLRQNDAEIGPRGLLRPTIGPHCCGHGDGTYDYIVGEFS